MLHYVTQARYVRDYKIEIVFDDNKKGVIDLEEIILNDKRPIFKELQDKKKFSQMRVDMDTIAWANGLDLSPDFLYKLL